MAAEVPRSGSNIIYCRSLATTQRHLNSCIGSTHMHSMHTKGHRLSHWWHSQCKIVRGWGQFRQFLVIMAYQPFVLKMFCQNYFGKPYDLHSSSLKSSPNATSSITSATSNNDTFHLELQATCKIAIKVNVLAIDTARLREELITAKHEQEQVFMQRDNITSAHQRLKQGVKVTLQCLMCKGVIEQPFTVHLSFHPEAILLENFRNHILLFTLAEVAILCDGEAPILPGHYYHCPTC
ncbi:hypothetical protein BD769DRAFT_1391933 [Suillus cothurnatus]|nr:hypothetical protein BD769DRAFT_1391933 [Suillus cothurnatus]